MTEIERLVDIMRILRSGKGCPWDREQTLETLRPYAVEEVYEVLDAIDRGHVEDHCEELGDLLLQVVFQARIREEEGAFCFEDVARSINEKLIRRHPHVFGDTRVSGSDEVLVNWNRIKAAEKKDRPEPGSVLDGVPNGFPALLKAQEVQKKAAKVGFDWGDTEPILAKIHEELAEVECEIQQGNDAGVYEEIGDLLFSVVNLARHTGDNAEQMLLDAVGKFSRRFREVESAVNASDRDWPDWSLEELDSAWNRAKDSQK
jgi:MazG family protein